MATKTANVTARVEPEIKQKTESIMGQFGISASSAINMFYRQIILTNSISLPISMSSAPIARDEMDEDAFNAYMQRGYNAAIAGLSLPATDVFKQFNKCHGHGIVFFYIIQ